MSEIRFESAGVLGAGLVGSLFLTTRIRTKGREPVRKLRDEGQPVLFLCWHGHLLTLLHLHRNEGVVVLVSEHDDGEYVTRVLHRTGFGTVRGSSTRGGRKGLKGLVRAAREGHDVAITPDGPKGPRGVLKPGALAAAQMAGLPVVGVSVRPTSAWRFQSWDGFMVPKPFTSIEVEYLEPFWVPRSAGREEIEVMAKNLGDVLNRRERGEAVSGTGARS
jgi:lysophospholipid acyltransferase (LPLAT)-like uncharacterized protein